MNNDFKKILSALILITGCLAFILSTPNNNLTTGLIYLTSTIIIWLAYVLILDLFNVYMFASIISLSGFLVAIAVLFLFGIEQVPYPIGAIVFHLEGIAGALGIGLFSFFPLIPLYYLDVQKDLSHMAPPKKNKDNYSIEPKIILDDEEWEIASENDLNSGEFELN